MTVNKRIEIERGIKVAIVGGGPAGLGAAIELAKLPFVDWHLYEQKAEISEISTGITLQRNSWRLLERMGAARHLKTQDFFRPADGHDNQYRNRRTGVIVKQTYPPPSVAPHRAPCRVHRVKLQQALLKEVDLERVRVGKKLTEIIHLESGRVRLVFAGGFEDEVDLLVGADGIRSATRSFAFPKHGINYTGMTAYRALVSVSDAEQINGITKAATFWYGVDGDWIYTCPLNDEDWEITCRVREPDDGDRSTWGRATDPTAFLSLFKGLCGPVRQLLSLVTSVQRYDYFGASRLETVTRGGNTVLIGDASHPLSGAFGAGAAFALEDAHVLAGALRWAGAEGFSLRAALELFDRVRSPHYEALFQTLDEIAEGRRRISSEATSVDENIIGQIENVSKAEYNWMYYHDADRALADAIKQTSAKFCANLA